MPLNHRLKHEICDHIKIENPFFIRNNNFIFLNVLRQKTFTISGNAKNCFFKSQIWSNSFVRLTMFLIFQMSLISRTNLEPNYVLID